MVVTIALANVSRRSNDGNMHPIPPFLIGAVRDVTAPRSSAGYCHCLCNEHVVVPRQVQSSLPCGEHRCSAKSWRPRRQSGSMAGILLNPPSVGHAADHSGNPCSCDLSRYINGLRAKRQIVTGITFGLEKPLQYSKVTRLKGAKAGRRNVYFASAKAPAGSRSGGF